MGARRERRRCGRPRSTPEPALLTYLMAGGHVRGDDVVIDGQAFYADDVLWGLAELSTYCPEYADALDYYCKEPWRRRFTVEAFAGRQGVTVRSFYGRRDRAVSWLERILFALCAA